LNILRHLNRSAISDPAIFAVMYEHNRSSVFRYIYSLSGGTSDDAEDLTAETFIRAWKARHRFDGDMDSAIGWLLGIARRLAIDDYRRKLVRKTVSLPSDLKANSTTEEDVLVLQQKQQLLHLLKNLSVDQREILVLRYTLGWRVNQIAAHIGMSENNVSVIIHRTLAVLREQWSS
jgi:RNA polymerase sigma-70 factor (ECF subfamily)